LNPYLSFGFNALVDLLTYVIVHLLLVFTHLWVFLPLITYVSLFFLPALLSLMFFETLGHLLPQTVDAVKQMLRNKSVLSFFL
jgi:hypothetical protein